MLRIEHLRLRLPPGYETQAESIARQVAAAIAERTPLADRTLEELSVGPVRIAPKLGAGTPSADGAVAAAIAAAIQDRLQVGGSAPPAANRRTECST